MVIVGASSMDGLPVDDGTLFFLQISGFRYLQEFRSTLPYLCDFASVLQMYWFMDQAFSSWFAFTNGTSASTLTYVI